MSGPSSASQGSWKSRAPGGKNRALKDLEKKLGLSPVLTNSLSSDGASVLYLTFLWAWFLLSALLSVLGLINLIRAFQPPPAPHATLSPSLSRTAGGEASSAASFAAASAAAAAAVSKDIALFGRFPAQLPSAETATATGQATDPTTQTAAAGAGAGAGAAGAGAGGTAGAAGGAAGSRAAMEVAGATGAAATGASSVGVTAGTGAGQAGSSYETGWGTSSLQGAGAGGATADVSTGLQGSAASDVSAVQVADSTAGAYSSAASGAAAGGVAGAWQGSGSGNGGALAGGGTLGIAAAGDAAGSSGAGSGALPSFQAASDAGVTVAGPGVTASTAQSTLKDMGSRSSPGGGVSATVGSSAGLTGGSDTVTQAQSTVTGTQAVPFDGPLRLQIIGTKLRPGEFVTKFKNRWACLLDYHKASWQLDPTPRPLPWPTLGKTFPSCTRREGFLGEKSNAEVSSGTYIGKNWPVADSLKYTWKLREGAACSGKPPKMGQFAGEAFCAAMLRRKGPLFMVGDSTSGQFFFSLLEQLKLAGLPVAQQEPTASCSRLTEEMLKSGEAGFLRSIWPLCTRFLVCGPTLAEGGVHVHFTLSQYLGGVNETTRAPKEQLWGEDVAREKPSVVLLNRGAHYVKNGRFVAELESTLQQVRSLAGDAMVIFRSTTTGHPHCDEYTQPLEIPLPLESAPGQWQFFGKQNKLAKAQVEKVGGLFFNVESMNSVRPDWHVVGHNKDCWHHCQPGPVDDWVRVFAIMLSEAL